MELVLLAEVVEIRPTSAVMIGLQVDAKYEDQ
jgi:hypothetical protein